MERRSDQQPSVPQQYVKIETLLEHARRDASEHGYAYLTAESLDEMARAARELRERVRAAETRLHVLADEVAEHGITLPTDFRPESVARVGCSRSQADGGLEAPASQGRNRN